MPIRLLPPEVAGRIAAGEVVERPASVVKELVENALDGGASAIEVEIEGGGARLIRVADDGLGIPAAEAALAFERHATSKLERLEDLGRLATLGFRGEALASIAAVAEVECLTRAEGEPTGTWLSLEGGRVAERRAQARARGTTVTVRELFRHLPARLQFLRSAASEGAAVAAAVSNAALAHADVGFSLRSDGRLLLQTPGRGDLREAAAALYGAETARILLPLSEGEGLIGVAGLISPAMVTRSRRDHYRFFINRRWVQSRALARAVDEVYRARLPVGRYPIAILHLTVPTEAVDVNVHPAKTEVRFRDEGALFVAVRGALTRALEPFSLPVTHDAAWARPLDPGPDPALAAPPGRFVPGDDSPQAAPRLGDHLPVLRALGQVANTYVVAEGPDGVFLIDQHAAHERLLYDRLLADGDPPEVQGLLDPQTIDLTPAAAARWREAAFALTDYGFVVEPFGERTILLRGVPAALAHREPGRVLLDVLEDLGESPGADWRQRAAASVACHSAVRRGDVLAPETLRDLVRQLEAAAFPRTCPHGRPTLLHLSTAQLGQEFGRR